ncbi:hypothetical protein QBC44DRAFT_400614 [Cladorrhinum sp. PSN332]|nr:hypothetical protein QBC44DRAFT_400614 [Cladorrhinum sp. PSN332]
MHVIRATEDFRKQTEGIGFHVEDMTPVKEVDKLWRLSAKSQPNLLPQEVYELFKIYNTDKDKARQEALWLEGTLPSWTNRMTVVIVIPNPRVQHKDGASTLQGPHEGDATITDKAPTALLTKEMIHGKANAEPPTTAREYEPLFGRPIAVETLRQQPEIVIIHDGHSKPSPIALQVGDILQLDDNECIHVIAGGIALISIRYSMEKSEQVVKNQDGAEKPMGSS